MLVNKRNFTYHAQMNTARQHMEGFLAETDRGEMDGFAGQGNFQFLKDFVVWLHHKELRMDIILVYFSTGRDLMERNGNNISDDEYRALRIVVKRLYIAKISSIYLIYFFDFISILSHVSVLLEAYDGLV